MNPKNIRVMSYTNLIVNSKNNITTITINRPKKLNALNQETIHLEKNF